MTMTLLPPEVTKHNRITLLSQNTIYQRVSTSGVVSESNEGISLLSRRAVANVGNQRRYSTVPAYSVINLSKQTQQWFLEKQRFWLFLLTITAPLLLIVCYALVFTIPIAGLTWALIKHLIQHPTSIRFCSTPAIVGVSVPGDKRIHVQEHASLSWTTRFLWIAYLHGVALYPQSDWVAILQVHDRRGLTFPLSVSSPCSSWSSSTGCSFLGLRVETRRGNPSQCSLLSSLLVR